MRIRKILTILAVLVLLVVIGGGAVTWMNRSQQSPLPDGTPPDVTDALPPAEPEQPDWCPAVEVIAAPGTWESSADDDPLNPQANPYSFMLSITQPLQEAYTPDHVKVWTLPYTAEFKNIQSQDEMSYDESRSEGTSKVEGELRYMNETCPNTEYILTGFSQGAVILGDVADQIGAGVGAVAPEKIRGVALVADGRRENGVGHNPGVPLHGVGAEIALEPLHNVVQPIVPGASMRGARPHGFGAIADRTFQICAPNDSICDAPQDLSNGIQRAMDLINANGTHAMYASNPGVIPGTTTNAWIVDWAHGLINR